MIKKLPLNFEGNTRIGNFYFPDMFRGSFSSEKKINECLENSFDDPRISILGKGERS